MAVNKEQIFSAADELAAAGQKPTLEAIRRRTGGSFTTISPVLNEWKARQAAAPLREPAPQAVVDRLAELGADVWAVALEMANNRLAAEREALEKVRAELEADRAEATELADRLQSAEASARGEADELRTALVKVQAKAEAAEQSHQEQRNTAAQEAQEAHRARIDASAAREEAAKLRGQVEALQTQATDQLRALALASQSRQTPDSEGEAKPSMT